MNITIYFGHTHEVCDLLQEDGYLSDDYEWEKYVYGRDGNPKGFRPIPRKSQWNIPQNTMIGFASCFSTSLSDNMPKGGPLAPPKRNQPLPKDDTLARLKQLKDEAKKKKDAFCQNCPDSEVNTDMKCSERATRFLRTCSDRGSGFSAEVSRLCTEMLGDCLSDGKTESCDETNNRR